MNANASRPIGRTSLKVTALGLGGTALARIPGGNSNAQAAAAMEAAWDAGIRYYDTAPSYGFSLSEHRIGMNWWHRPRDEFVISTKVGRILNAAPPDSFVHPSYDSPLSFKPRYAYDYDGIMRSFEDSLARLGLYRIDILLVHDLTSRHHPKPEDLERHTAALFEGGGYKALLSLRDQKVIGAFGAGLNSWKQCERLAARGDFDLFLLAGHYTLLDQDALASFLPMCAARNIAVVIGGVYNTGILVTGPIAGAKYDYRPASEEVKEKVRRIEAACRRFDVPMAAAALQFPLHHPAVATVIPGMGSPAEVASNVANIETQVPRALYETLKKEGLLAQEAPVGG